MITRDLQTFARVTGGALHGANVPFDRVQTDSRALEPNALFVALAGDRFDGHDFVAHGCRGLSHRRALSASCVPCKSGLPVTN